MPEDGADTPDPGVRPLGPPMELGNEFAFVRVTKVLTRNGERLEIESPRLGYRIRLDPVQLESLTWQPKETFSRFLEEPFGRPPPDRDDDA
jgi:hypothetical protein